MRTSTFKQSIYKHNTIQYTIIVFFMSFLFFVSCSDSDGLNDFEIEGTQLIEKIENATRVSVAATSLPAATASALRGDLADSHIIEVEFAKDFGYKVFLETDNESRV